MIPIVATAFALVIFFGGTGDGGRIVNTDLRYRTKDSCQDAAELINKTKNPAASWPPFAICVPVGN